MRPTAFLVILCCVLCVGYAGTSFKKVSAPTDSGIRYYRPATYILIKPAAASIRAAINHHALRLRDAYVLPPRLRVRYLSPGEPTGMDLCNSNTGTGINAPGAKPPRYGDGITANCIHRFAVRDDAPLRPPGGK